MGSSNGTLRLSLERKQFISGTTLRGRVLLSANRSFSAAELYVQLLGEETVEWQRKYNAVARLIDEKILQVPLSGQVEAGMHEFPFEYELPPNLAMTCRIKEVDGHSSCLRTCGAIRLCYFVRAHLVIPGLHMDLKTDQAIRIISPVHFTPTSVERHSTEKLLSLTGVGPCEMTLFTDKNVYSEGEVISGKLLVRNNTKSSHPARIYVRLVLMLIFEPMGGQTHHLYRKLCDRYIGEVATGETIDAGYSLPVQNERDGGSLQPNCSGKRFRVKYFVELVSKFSMSRRGCVEVPVAVVSWTQLPHAQQALLA